MIITIKTKPIHTSYEIICAADLNPPKNAYLELLDQPENIIPYTLKDEIVNKYNNEKGKSIKTLFSPNGITTHNKILQKKVNTGANKKINRLELLGNTISLIKAFNPSAIGCKKPKKPTTLGPLLRCIEAIALRSTRVVRAIVNNKKTKNNKKKIIFL